MCLDDKRGRTPKREVLSFRTLELKYMLLGAMFAMVFNNLLLSASSIRGHLNCADHDMIPSDFFSTSEISASKPIEPEPATDSAPQASLNGGSHLLRNSRILIGIFTTDNLFDATHRKWHRNLFKVWNDERTCSLDQFRESNDTSLKQNCEVIFTFVAGANQDPNAPTERLRELDTPETPIEFPGGYKNPIKEDMNDPDVTNLNIRENMEEGKSQTWLYFASKVAAQFEETATPIDYVMKLDSDAILNLHEFLEFKDTRLPPAPYNKNIFAGALRDKLMWYMMKEKREYQDKDTSRYEHYWRREHENVHLYLAGQMYLMSSGLAAFVAEEAPRSKFEAGEGGYIEGVEDHDIASMVHHDPSPVAWISIGKSQRFWYHPVKGRPRYEKLVKQEKARVNGELFDGKEFKFYESGKSRLGLHKEVKP